MGISVRSVLDFALQTPSCTSAKGLYEALSSGSIKSTWKKNAEPVLDRLRSQRRDAFCAYLLQNEMSPFSSVESGLEVRDLQIKLRYALGENAGIVINGNYDTATQNGVTNLNNLSGKETGSVPELDDRRGFTNRAAMFAHFLIDSEMDVCMQTSRIVQANNSIQLLMQRVILNLEDDLVMDHSENLRIKQQWQWMKNYRMWEAARKIFLYPENWIEPELRDDKTEFFKELSRRYCRMI